MKSFLVNLGEGCRVWFAEMDNVGGFIKEGKVAVITNKAVDALYGQRIRDSLSEAGVENHLFEVPEREGAKTFETLRMIYDELFDSGFERSDHVLAVGGGSVGDVAGFAAATFKRGMNLAYIPTTLLAQADSCIGGKTAINYRAKNMIGVFYQPKFVIVDTSILSSLPQKELWLGLVEIIKHAVIRDEELFAYLEANVEKVKRLEGIDKAVWRSCRIKASIVEKDERDMGARLLLNYGHTIGHAIEAASSYSISHGEAVSMGMHHEAKLANSMGLMSKEDVERQEKLLSSLGMDTHGSPELLKKAGGFLQYDKKSKAGELRIALPRGIGKAVLRHVSVPYMQQFLEARAK